MEPSGVQRNKTELNCREQETRERSSTEQKLKKSERKGKMVLCRKTLQNEMKTKTTATEHLVFVPYQAYSPGREVSGGLVRSTYRSETQIRLSFCLSN